MTKEFPIIKIENGYVVVDKQSWYLKDGEFILREWYPPTKRFQIEIVRYKSNMKSQSELRIIAHKGIASLIDSGLPLIDMHNENSNAALRYVLSLPNNEYLSYGVQEMIKDAYKAAGGYTENDLKEAFGAGVIALIKRDQAIEDNFFRGEPMKENTKTAFENFIKSLKRKLIAVFLEMKFNDTDPPYYQIPVIIDKHVIVKKIIYEN